MRTTLVAAIFLVSAAGAAFPRVAPALAPNGLRAIMADSTAATVDTDHDGLSDESEQSLLAQFLPAFRVDREDCAGLPALFLPDRRDPVATADGAIYGQATPRVFQALAGQVVELRYFHLWKRDCGRMGHPLDAEHVSVLVQRRDDAWRAVYWYAAAHESTVCDASQITRASTLEAEKAGAPVWVSRNKHASFLNPELCRHGCGADVCAQIEPLTVSRIVNLGEPGTPMNGSVWIGSAQWALAAKMARSDFDPVAIAKLERLPATDIAWAVPGMKPARATIGVANTTTDSLALSNQKTDAALDVAGTATGNALGTSYGKVSGALRKSAHGVGRFLGVPSAQQKPADATGDAGSKPQNAHH